jgi:hypothetical protein
MRSLAEVFVEVLSEEKPYRVRISGKGKRAGQVRVTMSDAEAQRHRSPSILKDREPQVGDHVRRPYDWNTVSVVTKVEKKAEPDKYGNTHTITHQALGRIWSTKSGSPAQGNGYKPSKVATPPKTVSVGLHPKHGWHSDPGRYNSSHHDTQPQGYEHFVVTPKAASYLDLYKDKK